MAGRTEMMVRTGLVILLCVCSAGVLRAQGTDPGGKYRLAQGLEQAGEFERAAALYRELYTREPANIVYFDGLQRMLVQTKRYDDAIALVAERLQSRQGDLSLRTTLAGIYQRAGREEEARREWEGTIALAPGSPNHYRIVASSMIEHRLLERAAELYRKGRVACADPYLFTMELAQLLIVMMDYEGATTELVAWLRKNPSQAGFVQGRLGTFTGKPDGRRAAMAVVERELKREPDLRLEELLAWLALEGKEFTRALELYRNIDARTQARGTALLGFAERAFREKAYAVSIEAYNAAIAAPLQPNRLAGARYGEANAIAALAAESDSTGIPVANPGRRTTLPPEKFNAALAAYRKITSDFPSTEFAAKAYYRIGMIQMERLFDLDGALASFRHAGEMAGVVRTVLHDVTLKEGVILEAKGDTTGAAAKFRTVARAADATPDQADEAQFRLAELAFFSGRFDDATALLDSIALNLKADYANDALDLSAFLRENADAMPEAMKRYGAAEFLARQHKNAEAIALFREAIRNIPPSPMTDQGSLRIAFLQEEMGDFPGAIGTYNGLLATPREGGRIDRIRLALAEAYDFGLRDKLSAIREYEKLLADVPGSIYAELARKRVRLLRGDPL